MGDVEPPPEKRIGDRERHNVQAHLQQVHADGVLTLSEYDERVAQCWAARTQSDLDALVRDLPEHRTDAAPPAERTAAPEPRRRRRAVVVGAVLAAAALVGGSLAADDVTAVFGSRVVQLAPEQDDLEVGVLFGSVEVVVPDDARVSPRGVMVFGSTACDAACDGTGTRPVTVGASGGFGSVDIVRQAERDRDDRDDRDDD
jgi:ApbE superfamily uncharacterized protein (UPF0280 family)